MKKNNIKTLIKGAIYQGMKLSFRSQCKKQRYADMAKRLKQAKTDEDIKKTVIDYSKILSIKYSSSSELFEILKCFCEELQSIIIDAGDEADPLWVAMGKAEEWIKLNF